MHFFLKSTADIILCTYLDINELDSRWAKSGEEGVLIIGLAVYSREPEKFNASHKLWIVMSDPRTGCCLWVASSCDYLWRCNIL